MSLRGITAVVLLLGSTTTAAADEVTNHVRIRRTPAGAIVHLATPSTLLTPTDLERAYHIDPTATTDSPTVALVEAFGYTKLSADLATYRAQFHLPPCTIANGCLRIVNQEGDPSPLPADTGAADTGNWKTETALDVDMVSAACPRCKILVVEADSANLDDLIQAQTPARGAAAISNSWGTPIKAGTDLAQYETAFDHPVPTFVSTGDRGYDEDGNGPQYPSTSAFAIAVGGTKLVPATNARGWTESAWSLAGSSCSDQIAKQAYESASPCEFHATANVSALADPDTGAAMYIAEHGGWLPGGGTSLAAPLVAAMVAGAGLAPQVSSAWFAQRASKLNDVTIGSTGSCALCATAGGWDGPTGFGSLDVAALTGRPYTPPPSVIAAIASPSNAAIVPPGFEVEAALDASVVTAELYLDDTLVETRTAAPFTFHTPAQLAEGVHEVRIVATDETGAQGDLTIRVTVQIGAPSTTTATPPGDVIGGCSVGGGASPIILALALVTLVTRRRGSRS